MQRGSLNRAIAARLVQQQQIELRLPFGPAGFWAAGMHDGRKEEVDMHAVGLSSGRLVQ